MDEAEALVRRYYDALASADVDDYDELLAADWRALPPYPESLAGRDAQKQQVFLLHQALQDLRCSLGEVIVAGDRATCRVIVSGRHVGLLQGIKPSGREVQVLGLAVHRFEAGRIVETWHVEDWLGALR